MSGHVALVGAGPGDPGLLTVRGRQLLEAADAVVFDRLGTEHLLALCRPDARLIDAGKAPGDVAMTQEQTTQTLVDLGRAGLAVVRLKGGDPFVFGRGGEEADALKTAGIRFEVVPGITSAIAAPAYAGIPVTHRGVATSFTVITGHEDPTKPSEQTDWAALARVPGTLVILMGMGRITRIRDALIAAGRPADQPAAAVQWGTTARQRHVVATLATLPQAVADAGLGSPAVIVVGEVAGLSNGIAWRDALPLTGRRVVVTRARAQASDLRRQLEQLGAEVIELPVIKIEPITRSPEIDAMVGQMSEYRMLCLTSVNGVDQLFARLGEHGRDARAVHPDAQIVAIGPATAQRLAAHGLQADVVPERYVAEGILEALAAVDLAGVRVLVARAEEARADLVEGLRARGAEVDEVALYATVAEDVSADDLASALAADYVTFTASSTVERFMEILGGESAAALRVISIGPITSQAARDAGLEVSAEAAEFTIPGVIAALVEDAGRA